jgi:trimethylamine:corrinoid methyltransferase-like protein
MSDKYDDAEFEDLIKRFPNIHDLQRCLIEKNASQQDLHHFKNLCLFVKYYLPST